MDKDTGNEKRKGIVSQIANGNTVTYSADLNAEKLESVIKSIFDQWKIPDPPEIVIYTGWLGMITFDLHWLGLKMNLNIKLWVNHTTRVPDLRYYFSLFKKSGNVKVKVVRKYDDWMFECYHNTTYLFTCKELNEFVIKALKSISMEETVKQYTNQELLEMRQWVRENFVPGLDDVDPKWHKVMKDEASIMARETLREIDDVYLGNEDY